MGNSFSIRNENIRKADITIEISKCNRILIITDLHIANLIPYETSSSVVINKLKFLVEKTNPKTIVILGDIIHCGSTQSVSAWFNFFSALEQFSIPVYAIPGNHDRRKAQLIDSDFHGTNVHFVNTEVLRVFYSPEKPPIIFGHDLRNGSKDNGRSDIEFWMETLRSTFSSIIPAESIFICGHTHKFYASKDGLSLTIQPFSCDMDNFSFGQIDFIGGSNPQLKCGELEKNKLIFFEALSDVPNHYIPSGKWRRILGPPPIDEEDL